MSIQIFVPKDDTSTTKYQSVGIDPQFDLFYVSSIQELVQNLKKEIQWGYYTAKQTLKKLLPYGSAEHEKNLLSLQNIAVVSVLSDQLDPFARGMDIDIIKDDSLRTPEYSLKQITAEEFLAIKTLYAEIEAGNTPLKIQGDGNFKQEFLGAIKKLMERPSGRALVLSLCRSHFSIIIKHGQTSELKIFREEKSFEMILNLNESAYIPVKTKSKKWTLAKNPAYLTVAHEGIHILHLLSFLNRDRQEYLQGRNLLETPCDDSHYTNLEELYTIQGVPNRETLCENMVRCEFDEPKRFGHGSSNFPPFTIDDQKRIHDKDDRGYTRVASAALIGAIDEVVVLLDHGANPQEGMFCAVQAGDIDIIDMCLQRGASLYKKNAQGATAAQVASSCGQDNVLGYLKEKDEKLISPENNDSILTHIAARSGHLKTLGYLLRREPTSLYQEDGRGCTPLDHAIAEKKIPAIQFLLKKGAKITVKTVDHFISCHFQNTDQTATKILHVLLKSLPEDAIRKVFLTAVKKDHAAIVEIMLENKQYKAQNALLNNLLPLQVAKLYKSINVMAVLLKYEADHIENLNENTAVDFNAAI